ncbi:MAG: zinc metallopeptidase [Bacilli bacterium]
MMYGMENGITMLLFLIAIIVVSLAQYKVTSVYKKNKVIILKKSLTGQEIARKILDKNALENIYIVSVKGELTDHYDPRRKVIRLSNSVFNENSISSASIAAHEVGHALQDKDGYIFMKIRAFLVPVVNFVTYAGYFVAIISLIGGLTGYLKISLIMILASLLFQLITLPVELNASKRAKEELIKLALIDKEEVSNVTKVLNAAAMTYIASFVSSLLSLLRIVIMINDNKD